jgi:hypothetical protein
LRDFFLNFEPGVEFGGLGVCQFSTLGESEAIVSEDIACFDAKWGNFWSLCCSAIGFGELVFEPWYTSPVCAGGRLISRW